MSRNDTPTPSQQPALAPDVLRPGAALTWRRGVVILGGAVLCAVVLLPIDRWVMTRLGPFGGVTTGLGGDVARELEFLQQFGAVSSMVIAGVVIVLLDRPKARRLLDLAGAMAINGMACNALKMLLGRPRPRVVLSEHALGGYADTSRFAFAWTKYPLPREVGGAWTHLWAHSWEMGKGISSDLWSMPSSHAASAACAAAALVRLYPALRPLLIMLMVVVAIARVVFGAHYPSDVALGLGVGYVIGAMCMDRAALSRFARRSPHGPA